MAQLCGDFVSIGAVDPVCAAGQSLADPLLRRVADPARASGWSSWNLVDVGGCGGTVDLAGAIAVELQRLPLVPSALMVQPPSGWTLVNVDTIAFSDGAGQTLPTTVLGTSVLVRATPVGYLWDFGDGSSPLSSTDPGAAYPAATITHKYGVEGTRRVTLTTTWRADFQVAGTPTWEPVTGTATTASTSGPLIVYTAHSRLVDGPIAP